MSESRHAHTLTNKMFQEPTTEEKARAINAALAALDKVKPATDEELKLKMENIIILQKIKYEIGN